MCIYKKAFFIIIDMCDVALSANYFHCKYGAQIDFSSLPDKGEFSQCLRNIKGRSAGGNKLFEMYNGEPDEVMRLFPDYFSFMFIRSHLSRVISLWQML